MHSERSVDVLVLGGGPAGTAAGALLARAGLDTILLDNGDSARRGLSEIVLPHALPILDQLGVHDAVRALPHTHRVEGLEFISADASRQVGYAFSDGLKPAIPHGCHVRRDELDAALRTHARVQGVEVLDGWSAATPLWEGERLVGVTVRDPDGVEYATRCRVCVDATGRRAFLPSRMGWRFPYTHHRRVAVRADFRCPTATAPGTAAPTTVFTSGGWMWLTPISGDTISAGAVMTAAGVPRFGADSDRILEDAIAASPEVATRLAGAVRLGPTVLDSDFSHRVNRLAGHGYCLVGDAGGFLDPAFWTGIFLALATAASAAEDIVDAFRRHRRVEGNDFAPTVALTRSLHRLLFGFIRAFHDPSFQALLLRPQPPFGSRPALASLLAGDVLQPGVFRRTLRPQLVRALAKAHHFFPPRTEAPRCSAGTPPPSGPQ